MKRIVASVGLVALASSFNTVLGQDVSPAPPAKPWNVSASLRGFYDDNINTTPQKTNSFGFEISPAVNYGIQNDQTVFKLGYTYTFLYYQKEPLFNASHYDQNNQFNGELDHTFNEKYRIGIKDSFIVGQEPDMLRAGNSPLSSFQRVSGNNVVNYGGVVFNSELTRLLGLEIGYESQYFLYADSGAINVFPPVPPAVGVGKYVNNVWTPGATQGGLLDRIGNSPYLNLRWQIEPQTVGILGYKYSGTIYTADEPIGNVANNPALVLPSNSRNSRSQYGYVGADHNFLPDFSTEVEAGVRYTDFYYSDPNTGIPSQTEWDPYLRCSLQYNYTQNSFVQGGIVYDNTATDVLGINGTSFTRGANAFTIFANVTHEVFGNLYLMGNFQFQNSKYVGGQYNNQSDQYYLLGINLTYKFNPFLSADIGYNYDDLNSEIPDRAYNRNRVYIGLTGMY
jgi:hypothetical protein